MRHRTNIYLDPAQVAELDTIKKADSISKADFIRQAINMAIVRWKIKKGKPNETKE